MMGSPAPTDGKATVSLVLGIVSLVFVCCYLGLFVGIPAVVVGSLARRDIRRSNGGLGGAGVALAGIITGGIGAAINIIQIVAYVAMFVLAAKSAPPAPTPYPYPTAPTAAPFATTAPVPTNTPPASYGALPVTTVVAGVPLRNQLAREALRAHTAGAKLVVMTTAPWSNDADEIEKTMTDPRMQFALAGSRIVRVDADAFKSDLALLSMERPDVPWFFLVDTSLKIIESTSADAWSENTAANIAPAMKKLVEGAAPAPSGNPASPQAKPHASTGTPM